MEKLNKYYALIKYCNLSIEDLNEMLEYEMDCMYNKIKEKIEE
jgi:hypothetical protein